MTKGQRFLAFIVLSLFVVLGLFQAASAQSISVGKLTGIIMDDQGAPLPGVTLEVTSPSLMGKRGTVSSARGTYVFLNLPGGRYTLTASMANFKTIIRENITISAAESIVVDIAMELGRIEENVTVTAAGPIVDAKTSTVDSKLDSQMLDKLPTSRDAFYDLALTTPGMYDHGSAGGWLPSPTAYGGASNENVFLVNGVDATNPRGASFGPLVRVNYNTVEEVRVVALGSKAEYGSFSGAAIDVLTKSGSNAFHGTAAYYFEPVKWRTSNAPAPGTVLNPSYLYVDPTVILYSGPPEKDYEINFTVGGPIIKDKIWFYGGIDYLYSAGKPPRWDLLGESWGRFGDIKISAEPFKNQRTWVSYHYENNDQTGESWGSQPEWDTSLNYGAAHINHTVSAQWQWLPSSTTIFTAKFLGFWTNDTPHIPSDAPANPGYINWWKWSSYGIGGAFPYIEGWKSSRQTIQADVSHYAEDFLGEHDIKFGAQFTRGRSNSLGGYFQNYCNFLYPYPWTQNVANLQQYEPGGLLFYNYHDAIDPFLTVATADSLGFFFDDQWAVSNRLTVNLGLRYDRMTSKYGAGYVYEPLTKPTDIANPTILRTRQGSGNIFDFKTWSPRVGITYSLTSDAKTVVRASFGRYYQPLMAEYLRRYGPDCPPVTRTTQFFQVPWDIADANGDGYIDTVETREAARWIAEHKAAALISETTIPPADTFSWKLNVAPGLKDQYTDQFSLNFERELFKDFSVSLTGIYKHAGNIFANIPINNATGQEWEYDRVPFTTLSGQTVMLYSIKWLDYNGDGVIDQYDVRWVSQHSGYKVANMATFDGVKPKRDYAALQLVFNKRYSDRWQGQASFVYAYSSGMANRIFGNDMNAEGPMFEDNNWMSTLNYAINNLKGTLPLVPKFKYNFSRSYTVP